MNHDEFQKLLETSWQRTLSPEEEARLHAWLQDHPQHQAEWEAESALNALLEQMPAPPPVSSNFTARIMARVDREADRPPVRTSPPWRLWWPRLAGAVLVAALALVGSRFIHQSANRQLLHDVRIVGVIADIPHAETLRDFEAIQELPPPDLVKLVDMELLAALE